ncbi:LPD25 domain-containing protein [Gottfriedia sp. NPDC056225]|uniref:LPD25 domain-containing protein n=1 Tax=Gottfriedia sp. NPDC056225 TaxID=3345751 RepID=UPI0035DE7586
MAIKAYQPKTSEERKKEIHDLSEQLNQKVDFYFHSSEQLKEYLLFKSKFYNFSNRNAALIENQFPGAEAVGNFQFWKKNGFTVNKGEKGIKIFKPMKFDYFRREKNGPKIPISKVTEEEKRLIQEKKIKVYTELNYTITHVFDIAQTNARAEDLPKLFPNRWLEGKVKDYELVYQALEKIAETNGIKIVAPYEELGAAKGVCYSELKQVALNPRNSELQNVKTLIHELVHAVLHTLEKRNDYNQHEREFQAELTAFTVASYLGLDTSEYSLKYIHYYTQDESKFEDKIRLLDEVKEIAHSFIETIESKLVQERNQGQEKEETLEPKVVFEYSDINEVIQGTEMTFKEANDFLFQFNQELQKTINEDGTLRLKNNECFDVSVKYKVIDVKGNIYTPQTFMMSKMEENQTFSSIAQQIYIQEPKLYKELCETYLLYGGEKVVHKVKNGNDLSLEEIRERYGHFYYVQNNMSKAELVPIKDMTDEQIQRVFTDQNYLNLFNQPGMSELTDDKDILKQINQFDGRMLGSDKVIIIDKHITDPMGYVVWSEAVITKQLMPLKELDKVLQEAEFEAKHHPGYEKTRVHYLYPNENGEMIVRAMDRIDFGDGSFKSIVDELKNHLSHKKDLEYMQSKWDIQVIREAGPVLTKEHVKKQIEHYVVERLQATTNINRGLRAYGSTRSEENEWMVDKFTHIAMKEEFYTKEDVNDIRERTTSNFYNELHKKDQEKIQTLETDYTTYLILLQKEKKGPLTEEVILDRLNAENAYYQSKETLLSTGVMTKTTVGKMEEKVSALLKDHSLQTSFVKPFTHEMER